MKLHRMSKLVVWIFGFLGIGFILGSFRMAPTRGLFLSLFASTRESSGAIPSAKTVSRPTNSVSSFAPSLATSQSNVLEIPKASVDFVGDWGGYETGTLQDALSGFAERVHAGQEGVTFGRTNDTVFLSLEIWGSPDVEIVRKPKAWITDPEEAIVEFESQDYQEYFVDIYTYQLRDASHIRFKHESKFYDRLTRQLLGIQRTHAIMKRLTPDEAEAFRKSSPGSVLKDHLSASKDFGSSNNGGN